MIDGDLYCENCSFPKDECICLSNWDVRRRADTMDGRMHRHHYLPPMTDEQRNAWAMLHLLDREFDGTEAQRAAMSFFHVSNN